jgi:hypothetical protein
LILFFIHKVNGEIRHELSKVMEIVDKIFPIIALLFSALISYRAKMLSQDEGEELQPIVIQ